MNLVARHSIALSLVLLTTGAALASACTSEDPDAAFSTRQAQVHGDSPYAETFETVARESGVPVEYLVGIAWVESRFATHPDEPSEPGGHGSPWLGHGMMRLVEGHTLERAAALTGLDVELLRTDPEANLRGAAAVLAELHRETGSWDEALLRYGPGGLGIDERAARAWVEDVAYAAKWGVSGVDSAQRTLVFDGVGDPDDDGQFGTLEQGARPDYGGASWQGPVCSGNYSNASRGAGQITDIVIHTCQGGYSGCWGWLKNCQSGVSAHYVVSSTGQIVQIVEEQDIAYHDGCFNTNSVGIEHEGFINDPDRWYTEAMYCESAKLTRSICDRNNITCTRANVRGHSETPDCSTHTDPGSGWDWNKYMEYVNCGCNGCCQAQTEVCNGQDDDCDGQADEDEVCEIALLHEQIGAYAPPSTTDVDADGRADVCGRGSSGVWCHLARDGGWSEKTPTTPGWSDASGWDDVTNYATFRMGDVNGDGHADLCARANAGVHCHLGSATGLDGAGSGQWHDGYADATGWGHPRYYTTLRLADVDGDGMDDLCARSSAGVSCRLSNGTAFTTSYAGPALSDEQGWDHARNYGTIRMGDVDGDGRDDLCARANARMYCWLAGDDGFGSRVDGPVWDNASGFDRREQWSTIRLADINGDGRDDLCARTSEQLECALSRGDGFDAPIRVAGWADGSGWADVSNYATLRIGDVDGDGAEDLCGRANARVHCYLYRDGAFSRIDGPEWSDDSGWDHPSHYQTMALADVDGDHRDDLCARAAAGWICDLSTGDGFGARWALDEFANDGGWTAAKYRRTLLSGGPVCVPDEEICNGADDDCDGQADEDGVCDEPTPDSEPSDTSAPDTSGGDTASGDTATGADTSDAPPDSDVSLSDAPAPPDASSPDASTADTDTDAPGLPQGTGEGCGCRVVGAPGEHAPRWPLAMGAVLGLATLMRRRRRARVRDDRS